eukprot:TRINITY_DN9952_c0_g1_i1.p1 TRINITY_DN9952_c0_g1~~TRINITY_DN9952_c0_g1_i1.p1  ORF type:complete len:442 (+),score=32.80 TRINITY_DN9952_c0_g1_i1:344-1669(+)
MRSLHLHHAVILPAIIWFQLMVTEVQQPYMDEEFHLRQTQTYLDGRWFEWDPKITTPPGLYLMGVVWKTLSSALPLSQTTDLTVLRSFSLACFILIVLTICKGKTASERLSELSITTLPIIFFFVPFYYTDLVSCLVLLHLERSVREVKNAHLFNFVLITAAVFLRQTNIIWVGFVYGVSTIKASGMHGLWDIISLRFLTAVRHVVVHKFELLTALVLCGGFVVYNGSIVLGDKSNHEASFHPTQIVYLNCLVAVFFPFAGLDGLKQLFSQREQPSFSKTVFKISLACVLYVCFCCYCLTHYCIAHPFTLSDNRHFTFYLWRRLGMMPDAENFHYRYLLVPLSLVGFCGAMRCLYASTSVFTLLYILCASASLVLSPLYEPRYFILPIVFLLLTAVRNKALSALSGCLHILVHFVVNCATVYLFLKRTFPAADGSVGRFMW